MITGWVFAVLAGCFIAASLLPFLVWHFAISILCRDQDLRKKYNASWALVTGASSGALQLHASRKLPR